MNNSEYMKNFAIHLHFFLNTIHQILCLYMFVQLILDSLFLHKTLNDSFSLSVVFFKINVCNQV